MNNSSSDFLNIEEAPKAKDTPSFDAYDDKSEVSQIQELDISNNVNDAPGPRRNLLRNHRRKSTNYVDALNLRKNSQDGCIKCDQINCDNNRGSMDYQCRQHDLQNMDCKTQNPNLKCSVDLDDTYVTGSKNSGPLGPTETIDSLEEPRVFKQDENSKLQNDDSSSNCPIKVPRQKLGRRNSFQYEDYKKHIYNRLNMFQE